LNVLQEQMVPAAQHQPGFRRFLRLTDQRSTGKGIGITLWETEADLVASETSSYLQKVRAVTAQFHVMPPFREVYE
jgi:heme-degrading monooxygenase HmoA